MDFSSAIEKIMPDVQSGSQEPFIIYRDNEGEWHSDYTQNQQGETFDWVEDVKSADLFAVFYTGKDFANGSFASVYDTVLYDRLRSEYYVDRSSGRDTDSLNALTCFFYDNVGAFSSETTDYLTTLERPLAALAEMCPFNLATNHEGWSFNESLAPDAVDYIENAVSDRLLNNHDKPASAKSDIEGYMVEHFSFDLAGITVVFAENQKADEPYLVYNIKYDNPLGMGEQYDVAVTNDYLEAMREVINRMDGLTQSLETERKERGLPFIPLIAADCVPNGLDADLTGKLIIIKPEALAPEYRTADRQLQTAVGGFGVKPDSRGNAVYCKDLYSGKESRFERYDVLGLADLERLPEWAKAKLTAMDKTEKQLNKECAAAIDGVVSAGYTPGEMAGTGTYKLDAALKTLTDKFGAERVNVVLAAIINKHDYDGRYSQTNKNWAKDIDIVPYEDIKYCTVNTHPAVLDGLVSKARKADTERQEKKPSLLGKLDDNKEKVERGRADRKDKLVPKKAGDLEVD